MLVPFFQAAGILWWATSTIRDASSLPLCFRSWEDGSGQEMDCSGAAAAMWRDLTEKGMGKFKVQFTPNASEMYYPCTSGLWETCRIQQQDRRGLSSRNGVLLWSRAHSSFWNCVVPTLILKLPLSYLQNASSVICFWAPWQSYSTLVAIIHTAQITDLSS